MSKKNLKKFAAVTLAATMAFGSTMMVFAEGEGDTTPTTTPGVAEGTGSYEGGEMKYPTLSVQLPTIPAGTYDYIADPNGLIRATNSTKYSGATFTDTTGVFFLTDPTGKTYTNKSAAQEVVNQNAQDVDVTIKLEQKTAGDSIIKYAESETFDAADTENKLYLAVTDDAATDAKVAALKATGVATLTTTVAGVPGNYEPGYTAADGYKYTLKTTGLTDWNKCSYKLTGAINKNATWKDDVSFPAIKVTWNVKEHRDSALSASSVSATANTLTVTDATVKKVTLVQASGNQVVCTAGDHYRFAEGTLTLKVAMLSGNVGGSLKIELSTGEIETVSIE